MKGVKDVANRRWRERMRDEWDVKGLKVRYAKCEMVDLNSEKVF